MPVDARSGIPPAVIAGIKGADYNQVLFSGRIQEWSQIVSERHISIRMETEVMPVDPDIRTFHHTIETDADLLPGSPFVQYETLAIPTCPARNITGGDRILDPFYKRANVSVVLRIAAFDAEIVRKRECAPTGVVEGDTGGIHHGIFAELPVFVKQAVTIERRGISGIGRRSLQLRVFNSVISRNGGKQEVVIICQIVISGRSPSFCPPVYTLQIAGEYAGMGIFALVSCHHGE